ncbi:MULTISPECIES: ABC transporter ATP-binding protein [unclassified Variovorax]|uniref:ABC transporter ATP-binding protein n=1 Tax=Variovorax sp. Sphag1AA TaxID=2587027 RepID=UPI0016123094
MTPPAAAVGAESAISIRGVSKRYGTRRGEVHALDGINVDIKPGSFVVIVGPSGCGKSSLLKMLAGLQLASTGEIHVMGRKLTAPRSDIGVVFQSPVLFPWRTVMDNLMLPVDVRKLDRGSFHDRALEMLKLVGLQDFADRYPWELSGGMQQRVSIARALIGEPALLLMDEPFGALDAFTREHMNLELQRIWMKTGKTIVLITHSISEAVYLADRVLVMSPRPGRFVDDIAIDLPRLRQLSVMSTPEFGTYVDRIRELFNVAGGIDA